METVDPVDVVKERYVTDEIDEEMMERELDVAFQLRDSEKGEPSGEIADRLRDECLKRECLDGELLDGTTV